jgi:hypothetical protein
VSEGRSNKGTRLGEMKRDNALSALKPNRDSAFMMRRFQVRVAAAGRKENAWTTCRGGDASHRFALNSTSKCQRLQHQRHSEFYSAFFTRQHSQDIKGPRFKHSQCRWSLRRRLCRPMSAMPLSTTSSRLLGVGASQSSLRTPRRPPSMFLARAN